MLSPVGWVQHTYVFVENRWMPLPLCPATAALAAATGCTLGTCRDVRESLFLPFGFALRLHRAALLGFGTPAGRHVSAA